MGLPVAVIPWFKWDGIPVPGLPSGFAIRPFGLLVMAGVALGIHVAQRRGQRIGVAPGPLADFIVHVVVVGFIGSHIVERLAYSPAILRRHPWDLLMPWRSMSSYGGFLFAIVGGLIWKHRRGCDIAVPLDQVAFGMPVGWLFGRTGCFLVHDHPGLRTQFILAVNNYQYPGLPTGPRHDLGLYEAVWSLVAVGLFFWLDRRPRPHGFYVALLGLLYGPVRFALDFLREGDEVYGGLTLAQYLSLIALAVSAWLMAQCYRRPATPVPEALSR